MLIQLPFWLMSIITIVEQKLNILDNEKIIHGTYDCADERNVCHE